MRSLRTRFPNSALLEPDVRARELSGAVTTALNTAGPQAKAGCVREIWRRWRDDAFDEIGKTLPPSRPARPDHPHLGSPRDLPRRRVTAGVPGRVALLHAVAHIELNAVDLACDIIVRFPEQRMPWAFHDDWMRVAADEARHFTLLSARLAELDAAYGDLPAHDGLWQAAEGTSADLAARLAVVPLVLEARGLDVTPAMIARLRAVGDDASADILHIIHDDEISHVAVGKRWFEYICRRDGHVPVTHWQALVRRHFKGVLKAPFNDASRAAAGFSAAFYQPLADEQAKTA